MKKILALIALITIGLSGCSIETVGPAGPPGPEGPTGPQGAQGESAYVFEYTDVYFVAPDYEVILPYPEDFEGLESDVTLVYLLWEITTDTNGNNVEIWRQLPQTVYTVNGQIQYNFDFTLFDTRLFLATEFNPVLLEPIDTDDWIVRAVIIPGNFWGRTSLDYSDYNAVKEALGLPDLGEHFVKERRL